MIIQETTTPEILGIATIHVNCWQEVYPFIPESLHKARSVKYREKQWEKVLKTPITGSKLYSLYPPDRRGLVGFCYCKPNDDPEIDAKSELHAAYVLPEFRGGLTGPIMMRTMVCYLKSVDLEPMCLWAFDENPISRWYRMMGWRPVIKRERVINGIGIPETGFICFDSERLLKRLERLIGDETCPAENRR